MSFAIVHRPVATGQPPVSGDGRDGVSWRTCLREVTFLDPGADPDAAGEPLAGADAYGFLLETICGLRSPMLGETQVQGQFRAFLASLAPADASWLGAIGRQLMADARLVRERHLRGLGSRCYGSEVRRHLDGAEAVALVGAGHLATELLPYLAEGRRVDQWTRQDIAGAGARAACSLPAAIVIAAPVSNEAVGRVARCYPRLVRVIDLRSAEERRPFAGGLEVVTLDDIFAAVETSAAASEARLARARRDIVDLAVAFERRQLLRPFGWDDLCA
ncbi:MAG TPA: hypothetical protein VMN81_05430 [Vicinamibacterales bacterium]|nr:hypothetical protein [Vicinamibacterales bacterium]